MKRVVIVEGPEDRDALVELGQRLFSVSWESEGRDLTVGTTVTGERVEIPWRGKDAGKSQLAIRVRTLIHALPPQVDADRVDAVVAVFDPDADPPSTFEDELDRGLASLDDGSPDPWASAREDTAWTLTRSKGGASEIVRVWAIAWRGADTPLDGLPDHQSLERLLDSVARRAHAGHAAVIEAWLGKIHEIHSQPPHWKACIHLWCALVAPRTAEERAARRFLGQERSFKPHVEQAVRDAGLYDPLARLFA